MELSKAQKILVPTGKPGWWEFKFLWDLCSASAHLIHWMNRFSVGFVCLCFFYKKEEEKKSLTSRVKRGQALKKAIQWFSVIPENDGIFLWSLSLGIGVVVGRVVMTVYKYFKIIFHTGIEDSEWKWKIK